MSEFKKHTVYKSGFDKRGEKPNYGINGGTFLFVLSGPLGAIDFSFSPSFFPDKTKEWLIQCSKGDPMALVKSYSPSAYTIGFHSPNPRYEEHELSTECCEYVDGGKCYFDQGFCMAEDVLKGFLAGGTEWLWPKLEELYNETFKD